MLNYRTHDDYLLETLQDPQEAAYFLEAAMEGNDQAHILRSLAIVVKAHGLSKTAKKSAISRMGLYKILAGKGNPQLKTFMALLEASGLRISFKPA